MPLINFYYYNTRFPEVDQETFLKLINEAEWEVTKNIPKYIMDELDLSDNSDFRYIRLKDCICKCLNFLNDNKDNPANMGINSVSNDGYSEAYSITSKSDLQRELTSNIKLWLSGTGLIRAL